MFGPDGQMIEGGAGSLDDINDGYTDTAREAISDNGSASPFAWEKQDQKDKKDKKGEEKKNEPRFEDILTGLPAAENLQSDKPVDNFSAAYPFPWESPAEMDADKPPSKPVIKHEHVVTEADSTKIVLAPPEGGKLVWENEVTCKTFLAQA